MNKKGAVQFIAGAGAVGVVVVVLFLYGRLHPETRILGTFSERVAYTLTNPLSIFGGGFGGGGGEGGQPSGGEGGSDEEPTVLTTIPGLQQMSCADLKKYYGAGYYQIASGVVECSNLAKYSCSISGLNAISYMFINPNCCLFNCGSGGEGGGNQGGDQQGGTTCDSTCKSAGYASGRGPVDSVGRCNYPEVFVYLPGESGLGCCCSPSGTQQYQCCLSMGLKSCYAGSCPPAGVWYGTYTSLSSCQANCKSTTPTTTTPTTTISLNLGYYCCLSKAGAYTCRTRGCVIGEKIMGTYKTDWSCLLNCYSTATTVPTTTPQVWKCCDAIYWTELACYPDSCGTSYTTMGSYSSQSACQASCVSITTTVPKTCNELCPSGWDVKSVYSAGADKCCQDIKSYCYGYAYQCQLLTSGSLTCCCGDCDYSSPTTTTTPVVNCQSTCYNAGYNHYKGGTNTPESCWSDCNALCGGAGQGCNALAVLNGCCCWRCNNPI